MKRDKNWKALPINKRGGKGKKRRTKGGKLSFEVSEIDGQSKRQVHLPVGACKRHTKRASPSCQNADTKGNAAPGGGTICTSPAKKTNKPPGLSQSKSFGVRSQKPPRWGLGGKNPTGPKWQKRPEERGRLKLQHLSKTFGKTLGTGKWLFETPGQWS